MSLPLYAQVSRTLTQRGMALGFWAHLGLLALAAAVPPLLAGIFLGVEWAWGRLHDVRRRRRR